MRYRSLLLGMVALLATSSCDTLREAKRAVVADEQRATEITSRAATPLMVQPRGVRVDDSFYVGKRGVRVQRSSNPIFASNFTPPSRRITLVELGAAISKSTNLNVVVEPDAARVAALVEARVAMAGTTGAGGTAGTVPSPPPTITGAPAGAMGGAGPAPLAAAPSAGAGIGGAAAALPPAGVSPGGFIYGGTSRLDSFLDTVAARYQLDWEFREDTQTIHLLQFLAKTYYVYSLARKTKAKQLIDSGVDSSSATGSAGLTTGGSGSSSGSGQNSSGASRQQGDVETTIDVWKEVTDSVPILLAGRGSAGFVPSIGAVSVRATKRAIEDLDAFFNAVNDIESKQVAIDVRIYTITDARIDDYGLDLGLAFQEVSGAYKAMFGGVVPTVASNAAALSYTVLAPPSRGGIGVFNGTQAIVQALSSIGKTTLLTRAPLTSMNNEYVQVQDARKVTYLAQTLPGITTAAGTTGGSPGLVPGTVTVGFNMSLQPRIMPNNQVEISYQLGISNLRQLVTFTSGGQQITGPDIDVRSSQQTISVNNGDTIVLLGFDNVQHSIDLSGVGKPENILLGGQQKGQYSKTALAVVMTPRVLQRSATNQAPAPTAFRMP